jgi:hypothetical protein
LLLLKEDGKPELVVPYVIIFGVQLKKFIEEDDFKFVEGKEVILEDIFLVGPQLVLLRVECQQTVHKENFPYKFFLVETLLGDAILAQHEGVVVSWPDSEHQGSQRKTSP